MLPRCVAVALVVCASMATAQMSMSAEEEEMLAEMGVSGQPMGCGSAPARAAREREAARVYRDNLEIKNVMNDLIERVETRAADLVADQFCVASQLAAEMEAHVVAEEMRRCAHECWIMVQTPTVVRPDIPAWQHGQPRGADVVNGVSSVTMRVSMNDLAPTMTLNPYAPVFTPRGFYGI